MKRSTTRAGVRRGTVRNAARGSSVFQSPDPDHGPHSVATWLDDPNVISEAIAEGAGVSLANKVLGDMSNVNTGTGWFASLGPEDLRVDGIAQRQEGAEYPMVRVSPGDLQRLDTDDIGGKFRVTDEAVSAGATDIVRDGGALIAQGIINALDEMTLAALDAAAESTDHGTMSVRTWQEVQLTGATPTPAEETPAAALIRAQQNLRLHGLLADREHMLVMGPGDEASLKIAYGSEYATLLDGLGITPVVSPNVAIDATYLVSTRALGGVVSKQGIITETWRDPEIRSTWVQVYCEPAVYINRPGNVIRLEGTTTGSEDTE